MKRSLKQLREEIAAYGEADVETVALHFYNMGWADRAKARAEKIRSKEKSWTRRPSKT